VTILTVSEDPHGESSSQETVRSSSLLLRRKALTLAVQVDILGGTYGPCQKYKALSLHNFSA
jgi:hypothetical protein